MVKKYWEKPELNELGLQETKECIESIDDKGLLLHICKWCGRGFLTHAAEVEHEANCYKNPAHKPVNPLPDGNEEDWIVPLS